MMRKIALILIVLVSLAAVIAVTVFGGVMYNTLAAVGPQCERRPGEGAFTPADFTRDGFDTAPYLMPVYEAVTFPSRDTQLALSAFYIPAEQDAESAPAVIVVHGVSDCKRRPQSLLPAGMLHRAGFNVLVLDLRNMGDSDIDNGLQAGGSKEHRDVLAAWDWLQTTHNIPPERIGLFGYSLGGATVLITAGAEPGIAAVWTDSAFADLNMIVDERLERDRIPPLIKQVGLVVGQVTSGDEILSLRPVDSVADFGERPLFLVHGRADTDVPALHAQMLADAAANVETWLTDSAHVLSMFEYPDEYERRLVDFFTHSLR